MRCPAARPSRPWSTPDGVAGASSLARSSRSPVLLSALLELHRPHRRCCQPFGCRARSWLNGWFQGDAGWYFGIARTGYFFIPGQQSSIAFFPTYPLAVRGLGGPARRQLQLAGSLLAVLAGARSRAALRPLGLDAAAPSVGRPRHRVAALYPYSFFLYGAMYADSLFLLCAIGAFVLLERRWYLAAGLVGALATAGRPVGVAVALGLVVRTLEILADDRRARGRGRRTGRRSVAPR